MGSPYYEATQVVNHQGACDSKGENGGAMATCVDFDEENSLVARAVLMTLTSMKGFENLDQVDGNFHVYHLVYPFKLSSSSFIRERSILGLLVVLRVDSRKW